MYFDYLFTSLICNYLYNLYLFVWLQSASRGSTILSGPLLRKTRHDALGIVVQRAFGAC